MIINKCPKCGLMPIIKPTLSDDGEGRIVNYKLGCRYCGIFVEEDGDLTCIKKTVAKWNEMTKGGKQ